MRKTAGVRRKGVRRSTDEVPDDRTVANLRKVLALTSVLNSTLQLNELLTVIMKTSSEVMRSEVASLLLIDEASQELVFRVALDQHGTRAPNAAVVAALLDAHTARVARSIAASWDLSGRVLAALEDQAPGGWNEPTSLGRSLSFGNLIGALAVLHASGRVSDETAKATVLAEGASLSQFERIWTRLTGSTTAKT